MVGNRYFIVFWNTKVVISGRNLKDCIKGNSGEGCVKVGRKRGIEQSGYLYYCSLEYQRGHLGRELGLPRSSKDLVIP